MKKRTTRAVKKFLPLLLLSLLLPLALFAQVGPAAAIISPQPASGSFTLATNGTPAGPTSSASFTCPASSTTCGWNQVVGSGPHPGMFVGVAANNGTTGISISSVTCTAGTMTLVGHATTGGFGFDSWLYYIVGSGLTSSTQAITVTFSGATSGSTGLFVAGSFPVSGMNQSSPFDGSAVTTTAGSATGISQNVTVNATGEWVVDCVFANAQSVGSGGIAQNSPQSLAWSVASEFNYQGGISYNSSGSTGTVSDGWNQGSLTSNPWTLVSVVVKPG